MLIDEAYKNGRKTWLSEDILNEIGGDQAKSDRTELSTLDIVRRFFSKFSKDRIGPLFATGKIGMMSRSSPSALCILIHYRSTSEVTFKSMHSV